MFRQWLRSLRPSPERNPRTRRPRPFVPWIEVLEGRDVPSTTVIASGLEGSQGSAVGPGGHLYVTEGAAGRLSRVNVRTGAVTTVASGLPIGPWGGLGGGAIDVAFHGHTPYVLVTAVAEDIGGTDVVGIYRVDGPSSFTVIADIGAWSIANPPDTDFFLPTGNQYAMEPFRGGFLVTDGHLNRVLHVRLNGDISEVIAFENDVPTGLAVDGNRIYVAQAGPIPHLPEDGKIVSFRQNRPIPGEVAAGARLLSDVEFGRGDRLYALSMGVWDGVFEGDPPLPDTGALLRVNHNGTFTVLEDDINRPTSLEFIRGDAYVVTFDGEVLRVDCFGHFAGAGSGDGGGRFVDAKDLPLSGADDGWLAGADAARGTIVAWAAGDKGGTGRLYFSAKLHVGEVATGDPGPAGGPLTNARGTGDAPATRSRGPIFASRASEPTTSFEPGFGLVDLLTIDNPPA